MFHFTCNCVRDIFAKMFTLKHLCKYSEHAVKLFLQNAFITVARKIKYKSLFCAQLWHFVVDIKARTNLTIDKRSSQYFLYGYSLQ